MTNAGQIKIWTTTLILSTYIISNSRLMTWLSCEYILSDIYGLIWNTVFRTGSFSLKQSFLKNLTEYIYYCTGVSNS